MLNKFMTKEQLNVKVGDRVVIYGWRGTVTEVLKGKSLYHNNEDYTDIRVHFDNTKEIGLQYQDGVYGDFGFIK